MRLVAKLAIACMLLAGISFGKDRRWSRDSRTYSSNNSSYRYYDNYSRYGNDHGYREDRYESRQSYRNLPPGIQKKLRRGGSLPPGHAKRMNRNGNWYPRYYR